MIRFWNIFQVPAKLAVWIIRRIYQPISRHTPPNCRYYPTCSEYAAQALGKFGLWRGCILAVIRIVRCNPWSEGGMDPIPDHFRISRSSRRR